MVSTEQPFVTLSCENRGGWKEGNLKMEEEKNDSSWHFSISLKTFSFWVFWQDWKEMPFETLSSVIFSNQEEWTEEKKPSLGNSPLWLKTLHVWFSFCWEKKYKFSVFWPYYQKDWVQLKNTILILSAELCFAIAECPLEVLSNYIASIHQKQSWLL